MPCMIYNFDKKLHVLLMYEFTIISLSPSTLSLIPSSLSSATLAWPAFPSHSFSFFVSFPFSYLPWISKSSHSCFHLPIRHYCTNSLFFPISPFTFSITTSHIPPFCVPTSPLSPPYVESCYFLFCPPWLPLLASSHTFCKLNHPSLESVPFSPGADWLLWVRCLVTGWLYDASCLCCPLISLLFIDLTIFLASINNCFPWFLLYSPQLLLALYDYILHPV